MFFFLQVKRNFRLKKKINEIVQMSILLNKTKIVGISGNIDSTKKAHHILEMPRLGAFTLRKSGINKVI